MERDELEALQQASVDAAEALESELNSLARQKARKAAEVRRDRPISGDGAPR
jgi:hypothetical protein